jgi:chaperonin GroES
MRPIHDRVIIRRDQPKMQTAGGLYIPEKGQEKPAIGIVIAAGTGRILKSGIKHPLLVKEGDKVLFSQYAGTDVTIRGEELLVLREDEILAIIYPPQPTEEA